MLQIIALAFVILAACPAMAENASSKPLQITSRRAEPATGCAGDNMKALTLDQIRGKCAPAWMKAAPKPKETERDRRVWCALNMEALIGLTLRQVEEKCGRPRMTVPSSKLVTALGTLERWDYLTFDVTLCWMRTTTSPFPQKSKPTRSFGRCSTPRWRWPCGVQRSRRLTTKVGDGCIAQFSNVRTKSWHWRKPSMGVEERELIGAVEAAGDTLVRGY
jgi:hypothetical protein